MFAPCFRIKKACEVASDIRISADSFPCVRLRPHLSSSLCVNNETYHRPIATYFYINSPAFMIQKHFIASSSTYEASFLWRLLQIFKTSNKNSFNCTGTLAKWHRTVAPVHPPPHHGPKDNGSVKIKSFDLKHDKTPSALNCLRLLSYRHT